MAALAELRKRTGAVLCVECGKCSTLCPLAPFGGFSAARVAAIRDPEGPLDGRGRAIQLCLTCAACERRCPQGVRFSEFVLGLRPEVPAAERLPCPHGAALQAAAGLAAELPAPERSRDWLDDDLRVSEEGKIALFVGCLPLFDELLGDDLGLETTAIARAAVRLLNRCGVEPVIVAEERCCGHDSLWGGDRATFEILAQANTAAFKARGVEEILTTCAECCRTWSRDYAEAVPGYRPRVRHLSEFLAERLETGELRFSDGGDEAVTYHDACRLGRHLGVYEAPRRLVEAAAGSGPLEMTRSGPDARCCGTPGFIRCDGVSRRLQTQRLSSAAETGAGKLLTTCPKCWIHFTCAQQEDRRQGRPGARIEVEDLTVFAAARLERSAGSSATAAQEGEAS